MSGKKSRKEPRKEGKEEGAMMAALQKKTSLTGVVQKFKKLSDTLATAHMIANLCINDSKNRENAEKLVQPVTPHLCRYRGN